MILIVRWIIMIATAKMTPPRFFAMAGRSAALANLSGEGVGTLKSRS